jgi:hypothetical protein
MTAARARRNRQNGGIGRTENSISPVSSAGPIAEAGDDARQRASASAESATEVRSKRYVAPRANVAPQQFYDPPKRHACCTSGPRRNASAPGLDFRDRPLHRLIHGPANLMIGLRYAFLVEVLA